MLEKLKNAKSVDEKEKIVQDFWNENKIFEKSISNPAEEDSKGDFSFYDGPPFATGLPHVGHILAGTIKDAIPRFQTMNGKSVRRKWGWDCHGLPIENLIEKKLNLLSKKDIEEYGIDKFNKEAQDSVLAYDEEWKARVPRLGRFVDMDTPYKTMDATYTESIWWAWKELFSKGLAYEGHKIMHICPRCETILAQSEVGMNYEDVTDISVTAKFELVDEPNTFVLAWTTTPWTLPGNVALAVNKEIEYVKIESENIFYILAKERAEQIFKDKEHKIVEEFKGEKLVGKSYKPVFNYFENAEINNKENIYKIWSADFVTTDTGTGAVHIAPAFGEDDMNLAKANNLPVIKHVKMNGEFTSEVTDFAGMKVKKVGDTQSADIEIIKWLAHNGKLFSKEKLIHSYPLCWRCKTPLLNYATSSWFVDVPKIKDKLISENKKISWTPEHIRDGRFGKWLEGAREWAVSRTRYWGAPLPVWKCDSCPNVKMIGSLKELAENRKSKNKYFVMRHGESQSNIKHIIDSSGDPENKLTPKGVEQATLAGQVCHADKIDLIIASTFVRARETAENVNKACGAELILDERLVEINVGELDGMSVSDYHRMHHSKINNFDKKIGGCESYRDVMNRCMACVNECEEKYEGKNILFVTHGLPVWLIISSADLKTDEEMIAHMKSKDDYEMIPLNANLMPFELKLVPRDETGAVNLHRPQIDEVVYDCPCGGKLKRIKDVFDCWFESGAMPFASIHYPFENKNLFDKSYPAEFIAEGLDQTRGWFYSLINLGVGLFDKAPFKNVIVNGIILTKGGQKMSKSENNYTDPMELVEKYGADSLRYFLLSSPVVRGESVQFSDDAVDEVYKKIISRVENVVQLFVMNKIENLESKSDSKNILDIWIISRLNEGIADATKGYEKYELDLATRWVEQFADDLSVWFVRRSRERLKGDEGEDAQKEALQTLSFVFLEFSKAVAPVMPFIAERIYKEVGGARESIHLEKWPKRGDIDLEIISDMKVVRYTVSLGLMKRTESKINVKQPLQSVTIKKEIDEKYFDLISDELNVKEVKINKEQAEEVLIDLNISDELRKEGDVRKLMRAIQDMRKEKGLTPSDFVKLIASNEIAKSETLMKTCKVSEVIIDENVEGESVEITDRKVTFSII